MVEVTGRRLLCTDCSDAVQFTDEELGYPADTIFRQQQRMLKLNPEFAHGRLVAATKEFGEGVHAFSTLPCQGCGTLIAGARFEYDLLEEV